MSSRVLSMRIVNESRDLPGSFAVRIQVLLELEVACLVRSLRIVESVCELGYTGRKVEICSRLSIAMASIRILKSKVILKLSDR